MRNLSPTLITSKVQANTLTLSLCKYYVARRETLHKTNGTGREVEAHVARAPLLSLFRREEPVDGGDSEPYTLHSYRSTSTPFIAALIRVTAIVLGRRQPIVVGMLP